MQNAIKFLSVIFLTYFFSSCSTQPYPYFDSAMNDHNRAPSSLAVPQEFRQLSDNQILNDRINADYLFLKADLKSLNGHSEDSIEDLKTAYVIDPDSATIAYKLAVEYYKKGQLQDALYWGEKSLEKNESKRETILFVAGLLSAKRNFDRAQTLYRKLIKINPEDAEAHLYLAALFSEKKDYKQAMKYFSELVTMPTFEHKHLAYYYRARLNMEMNPKAYPEIVKTDLEKSLKHKPDFLDALQLIGRWVEKKSGKEAAVRYFAQYQRTKGPFPRLAEMLSQYYIEKGDYDSAYSQLEILENTTEDQVQVKLKLALILIDKKMYDKSLKKLEELNELVPESDKVKFYLGAVYQELKKYDLSVRAFLEINSTSGHFEESRMQAAIILKNQNQFDRSIQLLKEVIQTKPESLHGYLFLSQLQEEQKNVDSAIETLRLAEKKFPQNPQVHYYLGTLYDKSQKKNEMVAAMNRVIQLDSEHVQALNYLAYSYAEMGQNLNIAETYALKAHQLDKNDPFIKDTLGWIYYQKGEYRKAVDYLEKAHKEMPEVGIIAEHLGDAYLKLRQNERAHELFEKAIGLETDLEKKEKIKDKISESMKKNSDRLPASER